MEILSYVGFGTAHMSENGFLITTHGSASQSHNTNHSNTKPWGDWEIDFSPSDQSTEPWLLFLLHLHLRLHKLRTCQSNLQPCQCNNSRSRTIAECQPKNCFTSCHFQITSRGLEEKLFEIENSLFENENFSNCLLPVMRQPNHCKKIPPFEKYLDFWRAGVPLHQQLRHSCA